MTTSHGARSEARVRRLATNKKRTLLRQLGMRQEDLDGIGRIHLDNWAKAAAVVELYTAWAEEHGWLDGQGNEPGWVRTYFAALNSSRLAAGKLGDHLKQRGVRSSHVAAMQAQGRGQVVPIATVSRGKR